MPIYEIATDQIRKIAETSFSEAGIKERADLQRLLRSQIEIISPETLVIAEEFGEWEDAKRRIDLLGLDKDANLVVIELKRTEDGGHMDLQAIRYAAMVSTMTFEKVIEVYGAYLKKINSNLDPRSSILQFLGRDDPNEDSFAQDVRIVLASAEFSKELTTAVLWLNDHGLDIRCVRIKPYKDNGRVLVDIQSIIPLPEAQEFQVQIKEKQQREREARTSSKDLTRFDVSIAGKTYERQYKRNAMLLIVKHLCGSGVTPQQIAEAISWRPNQRLFRMANGLLTGQQFVERLQQTDDGLDETRWFLADEDLIKTAENTYALSNQWGTRTAEAISDILAAFPGRNITVTASE
ncbi:MAG: hypothetical protein K2R98_05315 [Gemmataceae bacterium]|nr:hypothetical protein [Gemmataceae bacterium]